MILSQIKRITHDDFIVCSLNTKSFYHGLIIVICNFIIILIYLVEIKQLK